MEKLKVKSKILIVDDDKITPLIIEKYLNNQDYETQIADSAVEGSAMMMKDHFNLVITDINMPEINGLEFMLWIKQNFPKTNVIIMTAFGNDEIKSFVNQNGAVNYFEKPVNLKELGAFVQNTLTEKHKVEEINLIDFIQMIAASGQNKLVYSIDHIANKIGMIYVKGTSIVHATCAGLEGTEAFYEIIKMENAMFSDHPWKEPASTTIDVFFEELIIEAIRIKIDLRKQKEQAEKQRELEEKKKEQKNQALVRSQEKALQRANSQMEALEKIKTEQSISSKLIVYESGVVMGITLGVSKKDEVIQLMKNFSKINAESQRDNQMMIFDDLSMTVLFNENGVAEEINLAKLYKGRTNLGISIGDTIQSAIAVYGKPKICTVKGAVWDNIAFFSQDNEIISSIRLRNAEFFSS